MRIKNINIRLSEDEFNMLKTQSETVGLGISAYIRMLIYEKDSRGVVNWKKIKA